MTSNAHTCPYCQKMVVGVSNLYLHMDWCAGLLERYERRTQQ